MDKKWVPVYGFEKCYIVSEDGEIASIKTGLKKSQCLGTAGYLYVNLWINGKQKRIDVHLVVIRSFVGASNLFCDHIDRNKTNNNISNLRYVTAKENARNRKPKRKGFKYLTEKQVEEIPKMRNKGMTIKEIAIALDKTVRTIQRHVSHLD